MTATKTFDIKGMTCAHCVSAVSAELAKLHGVHEVDVDLDSDTVTVTGDAPLDLDAVRAAVTEAGYELVT